MRPVVGVIDEEGGRELQIVDLSQEAELAIESLVPAPRLPRSVVEERRRSWSGLGVAPAERIPVVSQRS